MKYILIIGDGMADNPVPELGNRTPLEAARIPHIDALARRGIVGSVSNCPKGLPAGSDTAITSIFGCDPNKYYTGRAPLEAAATGLMLSPGDIAYRCNMVCYEDAPEKPFESLRILSHSAGSIEGDESDAIVTALFADPEFAEAAKRAGMRVYPASSFRHIAVQSGAVAEGMKLCPPHDHLGEEIGPYLPSGSENAKVLLELMRLAWEKLDHHPLNESRRARGKMPANGVWFWAEGTAVELPDFASRYHHSGSVISAVPLVHGIGALSGLRCISVEGATGENDTNFEGKVQAAADALLGGDDFVCVHIEAPDEATHNGRLDEKLEAIEFLDSRVVAPLCEKLDAAGQDYRILILSDHKTLMRTRGHGGDPVPYLIYDSTAKSGSGLAYTEKNGETGPYQPDGTKLMEELFAL